MIYCFSNVSTKHRKTFSQITGGQKLYTENFCIEFLSCRQLFPSVSYKIYARHPKMGGPQISPQIVNPQTCGLTKLDSFAQLPQMWQFADLRLADPSFFAYLKLLKICQKRISMRPNFKFHPRFPMLKNCDFQICGLDTKEICGFAICGLAM
jgi:hypothetical protein